MTSSKWISTKPCQREWNTCRADKRGRLRVTRTDYECSVEISLMLETDAVTGDAYQNSTGIFTALSLSRRRMRPVGEIWGLQVWIWRFYLWTQIEIYCREIHISCTHESKDISQVRLFKKKTLKSHLQFCTSGSFYVSTYSAISQVCSQWVLTSTKAVSCHQAWFSLTEWQAAAKKGTASRLMTSAMQKSLGNQTTWAVQCHVSAFEISSFSQRTVGRICSFYCNYPPHADFFCFWEYHKTVLNQLNCHNKK